MAKLLYIESSPRKDRSYSIQVAREFLSVYRQSHPGDAVDTLDLWAQELPEFNGDTINAKYAILHGLQHTDAQARAWNKVVEIFRRFSSADRYLFSLPMWNFGIPYKLKHYIDVLTQPGLAFSYSPSEGYKGLVSGKPAVVVYARGGSYPQGSGAEAMDFQKTYFEMLLKFIGFTDIRPIVVEPTLADKESAERSIAAARDSARALARAL